MAIVLIVNKWLLTREGIVKRIYKGNGLKKTGGLRICNYNNPDEEMNLV
jgi:hypothetical protein